MANAVLGEVDFPVGDEVYTLVLDFNALCEAEGIIGDLTGDGSLTRLSAVRAMMWAALLRHHPDLTLSDVGDLIGKGGFDKAAEALAKAQKLSDMVSKGGDGKAAARPPNRATKRAAASRRP